VAKLLNEKGVPTAHGAEHWSPQTVRKILDRS
jgi:Recombinase